MPSTSTSFTANHPSRHAPVRCTNQSPKIQALIIAGFMMPRSRRRSITLNRSDSSEPASASA